MPDNDHRGLIEEVRATHRDGIDHDKSSWGPWCYRCQAEYPCLTARLAEALEAANAELSAYGKERLVAGQLRGAEVQNYQLDLAEARTISDEWREARDAALSRASAAERRVAELEQERDEERTVVAVLVNSLEHILICNDVGRRTKDYARRIREDYRAAASRNVQEVYALRDRAATLAHDLAAAEHDRDRALAQRDQAAGERDGARKAVLGHHTIYRGLGMWTCNECAGVGGLPQDIDHGEPGSCWVAAAVAPTQEDPS